MGDKVKRQNFKESAERRDTKREVPKRKRNLAELLANRCVFFFLLRPLDECKEECLFNAVCVVEQVNARCSCDPIQCDGTYKPVCGRNGHTYSNDCMRRKAECFDKARIPVKHPGPCGEWRREGNGSARRLKKKTKQNQNKGERFFFPSLPLLRLPQC